jgi:hypothetical protein
MARNHQSNQINVELGAQNLLNNYAGVSRGDQIVIVGETGPDPFFESELCDIVAREAQQMGCEATIIMVSPMTANGELPKDLTKAMETADVTIFFTRLGDQLRFTPLPGSGKKIMTYTVTREHLGAAFGLADYHIGKEILQRLMDTLINARSYHFKAPCGTNLISQMQASDKFLEASQRVTDFSVDLFPEMIFPPITCLNMEGKFVIRHFLLSTSTRIYENSAPIIKSDVIATVENSKMIAFDGDPGEVKVIKNQLEKAAAITGGDPYIINSWHTGINPNTFFHGNPYSNLEHWGTVAFGSPRYTHLHCAGNDPGDVSLQLFDATITCDGEILWDNGQFIFLDKPEIKSILQANKEGAKMINTSLEIGI